MTFKVDKEIRQFSAKIFLLTILLGGIWSVIFNLLFMNGETGKETLIEIYRYSLITMDLLFSFFMFFIVWKKFGFFTYFIKKLIIIVK